MSPKLTKREILNELLNISDQFKPNRPDDREIRRHIDNFLHKVIKEVQPDVKKENKICGCD